MQKNSKEVLFGTELDLSPFVVPSAEAEADNGPVCLQYSLYGVVVHQGGLESHSVFRLVHCAEFTTRLAFYFAAGGMDGGHYIAYVNKGPGTWYMMSDSHTQPASERDVLSSQAFLLFYKRRN